MTGEPRRPSARPWVSSERLQLWPVTEDDVSAAFEIHSDPRTYEHVPDARMRLPSEAVDLIEAWMTHWRDHGFGYAAVRRAGDSTVIGFAGLKHQQVVGVDALNIYYRFAPDAWGQGFAGEAVGAAVRRAQRQSSDPVFARIATNNPASERVVERLGFTPLRQTDARDAVPHRLWVNDPAAFGE